MLIQAGSIDDFSKFASFLLMNYLYILLVSFCLIPDPSSVFAQQYKTGNVVIHSDPRLLFLKKNPAGDDKAASNSNRKVPGSALHVEKGKSADKTPDDAASNLKSGLGRRNPEASDTVNKVSVPKIQAAVKMGTTKGFRVQLYSGSDREKANNLKKEFSKRFPGIPEYMVFTAPSFRLKAGDFTNRNDAAALLKKVKTLSSISMIIPDNIVH